MSSVRSLVTSASAVEPPTVTSASAVVPPTGEAHSMDTNRWLGQRHPVAREAGAAGYLLGVARGGECAVVVHAISARLTKVSFRLDLVADSRF